MAASLLLVTPNKDVGERLRTKIARAGFGDLRITDDFVEAIKITRQRRCRLALLDVDVDQGDASIIDIGYALRQINPEIHFILLESRRRDIPEGFEALKPLAALPAGFDFSLLHAVLLPLFPQAATGRRGSIRDLFPAEDPDPDDELPWLTDVNRAAQHLTRLTLESAAQAALITRRHELWAYAGQFPRAAAQELASSIQRHWNREEEIDLLSFVRLSATSAEHMLYATRLNSELILALVFDSETPFSTIRSQAGKLASSLSATPPDATGTGSRRHPSDLDELADLPPLSTLLVDVPPADPLPRRPKARAEKKQEKAQVEKVPVDNLSELFPGPVFSLETPTQPSSSVSPEPDYEIADGNLTVEVETEKTEKEAPSEFAQTRQAKADPPGDAPIEQGRDARENAITQVGRRILLEPASPAVYNLDYACLLIPRFDNHYLTGELSDRLPEWMQQICVAFGWRLESIAVRPDYLQWVASVPPANSPSYLMRIIRQQTSDRIFVEFPRFHRENPSGDFWAAAYLIMGGSEPHPQKLIRDFIKQTRQRQGIGHPR
jgi:REP element-mobilizing transposase RayT